MAPTHSPAPRNTIETYSARPEREPPRNENGDIICTHENCREKTETFRRPCEWNKHMDKHERPYKCNEPTCEQNPGFTYSGGLLRHMREVHKKGVGPTRKPLFCPHANCIRSTGEGFTRRENLEEHLRRRHSYTGHYSPPVDTNGEVEGENGEPSKKRRKTDLSLTNGKDMNIDERLYANGETLDLDQAEANRQLTLARQTIEQQQIRINQQETEIYHLRSALGSQATAYQPQTERSLPLQAAEAMSAQLQQEVHRYPDPDMDNQDPQLNDADEVLQQELQAQNLQPIQAQQDNDIKMDQLDQILPEEMTDAQRGDIARELTEKLAAAASAQV